MPSSAREGPCMASAVNQLNATSAALIYKSINNKKPVFFNTTNQVYPKTFLLKASHSNHRMNPDFNIVAHWYILSNLSKAFLESISKMNLTTVALICCPNSASEAYLSCLVCTLAITCKIGAKEKMGHVWIDAVLISKQKSHHTKTVRIYCKAHASNSFGVLQAGSRCLIQLDGRYSQSCESR